MNNDEFLWVEKYRPSKIEECVLPENVKNIFLSMVKKGVAQNMLFHGPAGVGKTSVACALATELDYDWILINSALENGIDVLRTKISQFVSTVSMNGKPKMVILDEADRLSPATQDGLKAFQEDFSGNCVFILTSNHPKKIIPAIHSRCPAFDFKIPNAEKPRLAGQIAKRLEFILDNEGVTYSKEVLHALVIKYFPDFRRTIGELQRYSNNDQNEINPGILGANDQENAKELLKVLKDKSFKGACAWINQNSDMDSATLYRFIFDVASNKVANIANLVLILADFQYKEAFMQDRELNSRALFVELMGSLNWKNE